MPVLTRFSSLSDIEFERELEHRARSGQLVLGAEMTQEAMERVRVWVGNGLEYTENLERENQELQREVENLKDELLNA